MIPHHSTHQERALQYIAAGATPGEVARALGITPSAVTQLLSTPEAEQELAKMREEQIKRSSALDSKYDSIESKLLDQLERTIPLLLRPGEIANVLTRINSAKRRGVAGQQQQGPAKILQLNIPVALQAKFVVNSQNQVVSAGEQNLVTIQSANIAKLAEAKNATPLPSPTASIEEEDEYGFTHKR